MRIVVADDDRGVRESLRRSLELNGYTVELAEDGQQAMEAVARQRPDAMVLDITMPRMDGLEVCQQLRSAGDDLPVLVLTARDAVSDRVAGLDAGADDYLPKPFHLDELLARLRVLLRRSTFDRPGNLSAVHISADSDLSAHGADSYSSPTEAPVGGAESVIPGLPAKRRIRLKTRLTARIIGIASVIVAAIGLIPPFAETFWVHDAPDSKASYSNVASCVMIRKFFDVNGIPQAVASMDFRTEMRTRGREYANWLVLTLILTNGSLRTEERRIEGASDVVIFPLDFLSADARHHILMVDVDVVRVTDVPVGACLQSETGGMTWLHRPGTGPNGVKLSLRWCKTGCVARRGQQVVAGDRLPDRIGIEVLAKVFTPEVSTGRREHQTHVSGDHVRLNRRPAGFSESSQGRSSGSYPLCLGQ